MRRVITLGPADLKDITSPSMHRNLIEVDNHGGVIPGIQRYGEVGLTITSEAKTQELLNAYSANEKVPVKITMPDGTTFLLDGFVTSILVKNPIDDLVETEVKIRPTGPVTIVANYTVKERKVMKVRNRFYVAAPHVTTESEQAQANTPDVVKLSEPVLDSERQTSFGGRQRGGHHDGKWTRKDLAAAIAHGEAILAAQPSRDHVAIVKIVKIVRRPKPKFVVEDVK